MDHLLRNKERITLRKGAAKPLATKETGKVTQAYTGMGDGDGQTFAEKLNFRVLMKVLL